MLALLCTVLQRAWAQANWDAVYKMTQTTSANWTALNSGSTTGNTLYLLGQGTVNATGGRAANGGNGGNGDSAGSPDTSGNLYVGGGGAGGNGGGGAGAGIGGNGGQNGDGTTYAPKGGSTGVSPDYLKAGMVDSYDNYSWDDSDADYSTANGVTSSTGGSAGARGSASTAVSIRRLLATDAEGTYFIYNAADWDGLSALVAEGNTFSGKTVKLTVDISVSAMVGSSRTNSFRGIFDGQGHTLTFTIGTASDRYVEYNCAPFRYVNGATIYNLAGEQLNEEPHTGVYIQNTKKYAK